MINSQNYKPEAKKRNNMGAFWEKTSKKDGSKYWTGKIEVNGEVIEIIMFTNTNKNKETHPDLLIRKQEKRQDISNGGYFERG